MVHYEIVIRKAYQFGFLEAGKGGGFFFHSWGIQDIVHESTRRCGKKTKRKENRENENRKIK